MPETDSTLDILKAIRESAYSRWEKRRYEWKLSFGIWTALAAFIAIALTREIRIQVETLTFRLAAGICLIISAAHFLYLLGIIKHTVVDVKKQYWAEEEMETLLTIQRVRPMPNGSEAHDHWFWPYVGFLQSAITLLLSAAAVLALYAPRLTK